MQSGIRSFLAERRKGKSSVLLIIAIVLGVCWCLSTIMQYMDYRKQENILNGTVSLFDSGKRKEAIKFLRKEIVFFSDSQKKTLIDAVMRYVDSKVSAHDYEEAIETLNEYAIEREIELQTKYNKLNEVNAKYLSYSIEKKDYKTAMRLFQARGSNLNEKERQQMHEVLTEYAFNEAEAGNMTDSVKYLREFQSDSWPEGKDVLNTALSKYAAKITEEISGLSSPDYELARTKGSKLDAVDFQLKYCHDLYKLSYDIKQVYPDGVEVIDTDIREYHIKNIISSISGKEVNYYPMIIFSRRETSLPMYNEGKDPNYSVSLLPGEMFIHGAEFAAKSFAEAESLLLADAVYIDAGTVTEITTTVTRRKSDWEVVGRSTSSRDMSVYSAVNNLAMYSVKNPLKGVVMIVDPHAPQAADEEWLKEQHESLYSFEMLGKFDSANVMENLRRVIEYAYMYRDAVE